MTTTMTTTMTGATVAVAGGSGFIGRHVVQALRAAGAHVVVVCRHPERWPSPVAGISLCAADLTREPPDLAGCDAVVNLVGIKAPHGDTTFHGAHVQTVANLVTAMQRAGIRRLVHLSVVSLPETLGPYAATKHQGERAVMAADLDATILRPALVVGPGDDALTNIVRMVRAAPVFPIAAGPLGPLAPVDVRDVAACVVAALGRPDTVGATIDVVGPEVLDLRALVRRVAAALGLPIVVLLVPARLQRWAAAVMERLPGTPLITRSQLSMLAFGLSGDTTAASQRLGVGPRRLTDAHIAELAAAITDRFPSLRIAPTAEHRRWLAARAHAGQPLRWLLPLAMLAMLLAPRVLPNIWIRMAGLEVLLAAAALWTMPGIQFRAALAPSGRNVATGLLAAVGLAAACTAGFAVLGRMAPALVEQAAVVSAWPASMSLAAQLPLLVVTVAAEDVVWRAAVGLPLAARAGPMLGAVGAGMLFALAHIQSGPPLLWLAALLCGAFWTALLIRTRSLVATMVCHLTFDVILLYVLPLA